MFLKIFLVAITVCSLLGCMGANRKENKRLAAAESQKFSGNFTAPVYKNTSMSGKIVLGWHQVTSQDGNNTFDSCFVSR